MTIFRCTADDKVEKIIHKHMFSKDKDTTNKCGDCSRRKWYQKGYEDGKNNDDGWVPVEECLPEDGQTVLCTDGEYVYLVEYDADLDAPFGELDNITHWQSGPKPYRPERSDNHDGE